MIERRTPTLRLLCTAPTLAAMVVGLSACAVDEPTAMPASIALSASPSSLAVMQGDSNAVRIDIVRTGGFTGPVDLAVSGVPVGVTARIMPRVSRGIMGFCSSRPSRRCRRVP